jgi:peptidoglycan/xylan/chitin deacetylase (PgdA/CDA1 family)
MHAGRRRGTLLAGGLLAGGVALLVGLLTSGGSTTRGLPPTRAHGASQVAVTAHESDTHKADESKESPEVRKLVALGKPIYCAGQRGNEVALTFDDGPGTYTSLAITKLRKHDVKATFFIVGRNISLLPKAIPEERRLGAVGDHTFTHPLLTALPRSLVESEIVRTQRAVARASGSPVFLFRPPYGAHDATVDSIARRHNLLEILWTVDSRDSLGANYAQIERNVIGGMHPGAIILMHENHGQTIRAMLSIFAAIKRKRLRTVSVPKLLTDDPPSEARVRAGGLGCGASASTGRGGGCESRDEAPQSSSLGDKIRRVTATWAQVAGHGGRGKRVGSSLWRSTTTRCCIQRIECSIAPSRSISMRTTSREARKRGGSRPIPTPLGVPVRIRSPGSKVHVSEMKEMSSGILKMRFEVEESWRSSPLTHVRNRRTCGSGISSAVVIQGP